MPAHGFVLLVDTQARRRTEAVALSGFYRVRLARWLRVHTSDVAVQIPGPGNTQLYSATALRLVATADAWDRAGEARNPSAGGPRSGTPLIVVEKRLIGRWASWMTCPSVSPFGRRSVPVPLSRCAIKVPRPMTVW